ncbi:hypothetical protein BH23ACT5_BH23ACT5_07080 [soil metagenome]
MAYVEVKAKTVELAIEAAMRELGITERDRLEVKVLQEPERGFLGMGGRDAIVKVEEAPSRQKRSRNRRSKSPKQGQSGQGQSGKGPRSQSGQGRGGPRTEGGSASQSGGQRQAPAGSGGGERDRSQRGRRPQEKPAASSKNEDREEIDVNTQEPLVRDFLSGLVDAFGLEGQVETRIQDDVIVAEVLGDQTEALVGPRGSVMEAVHELTKTVLQRTVRDSARVRIDIAGYAERRRQALSIYAQGLIEQVMTDSGEIMLEPMSASDRKVIHDAVAERDGVRSYSEGESPKRYVVIAHQGSDGEQETSVPDAGDDDVVEGGFGEEE